MVEETERETKPKKIDDTIIIKEPAEDIYEIYMMDKTRFGYVKTMRERYSILFDLVKNGMNMLPNDGNEEKKQRIGELKKKARKTLQDEITDSSIYPSERTTKYKRIEMDTEDGQPVFIYEITSKESGNVEVETKDLEKGHTDSEEQQCQALIPKLMKIHNEIEDELIKNKVIDVYNPPPKDLVRKFLREEMQKLNKKQTTGEQEGKNNAITK